MEGIPQRIPPHLCHVLNGPLGSAYLACWTSVRSSQKKSHIQPNSPLCISARESLGAVPAIIINIDRLQLAEDLSIAEVCSTCPAMIIAIRSLMSALVD